MPTLIVFPLAATMLIVPPSKLQFAQAPAYPVHTFEERWEPVRRMPPMIDLSQGGAIKSNKEGKGEPDKGSPESASKGDKQINRLIPLPDPIPEVKVRTIKIEKIAPIEQPSAEPVREADPPVPRARPDEVQGPPSRPGRARVAMLDICQRHGMRKVATNGGRSWRCRK